MSTPLVPSSVTWSPLGDRVNVAFDWGVTEYFGTPPPNSITNRSYPSCWPTLTVVTVELLTVPPLAGLQTKPLGGVGDGAAVGGALGVRLGLGDGMALGEMLGEEYGLGEGREPVAEPQELRRLTMNSAASNIRMAPSSSG